MPDACLFSAGVRRARDQLHISLAMEDVERDGIIVSHANARLPDFHARIHLCRCFIAVDLTDNIIRNDARSGML